MQNNSNGTAKEDKNPLNRMMTLLLPFENDEARVVKGYWRYIRGFLSFFFSQLHLFSVISSQQFGDKSLVTAFESGVCRIRRFFCES